MVFHDPSRPEILRGKLQAACRACYATAGRTNSSLDVRGSRALCTIQQARNGYHEFTRIAQLRGRGPALSSHALVAQDDRERLARKLSPRHRALQGRHLLVLRLGPGRICRRRRARISGGARVTGGPIAEHCAGAHRRSAVAPDTRPGGGMPMPHQTRSPPPGNDQRMRDVPEVTRTRLWGDGPVPRTRIEGHRRHPAGARSASAAGLQPDTFPLMRRSARVEFEPSQRRLDEPDGGQPSGTGCSDVRSPRPPAWPIPTVCVM